MVRGLLLSENILTHFWMLFLETTDSARAARAQRRRESYYDGQRMIISSRVTTRVSDKPNDRPDRHFSFFSENTRDSVTRENLMRF